MPADGTSDALNAKRGRAFELVSEYQRREHDAYADAPAYVVDVARWQGLLNKPAVTWEEAKHWPESLCDQLIEHYDGDGRRFVW